MEATDISREACDRTINDLWDRAKASEARQAETIIKALRDALDAAGVGVGDGPKGGVRFAIPDGDTREKMRDWLANSKKGKRLTATGDCLLVWANEGDLFQLSYLTADPSGKPSSA